MCLLTVFCKSFFFFFRSLHSWSHSRFYGMVRWPVKTLPGCEDLPPTDAHRSHRGSWRRCDRWSEEFRSVHSCFTANHWSHWDRWHLNLTAVVQGDFFWQCKGHMVPGWWKIPTICQLLVLYREGLIAWRGVFIFLFNLFNLSSQTSCQQ